MIEEIRIMILYRSAPNRSANSWILKTGRMETRRARRSLSKGLRRLRQPFASAISVHSAFLNQFLLKQKKSAEREKDSE